MSYLVLALALIAACSLIFLWQVRRRNMDRWLGTYVREVPERRLRLSGQSVHVLLCIADHFEPKRANASSEQARARVAQWLRLYPLLFARFRDSDDKPPQHTFFYPVEEYEADYLDALGRLCRLGFGEVEIHLHHDRDTADNLRKTLRDFKLLLAERHGLLARRPGDDEITYAFIHGNWALDNSHPHGKFCGVQDELGVLRATGCYADFTLPSAPSPIQTSKINSVYYASGPGPKAHNWGINVGKGPAPAQALMLIQGPLTLDWERRKWGLFPRIENGCLQGTQPPTMDRLRLWLRARVQVCKRPDWFFVKLHTHGALEANWPVLLADPMVHFHEGLARAAAADSRFHYHYVTAREMYNLARAAEAGWTGSVAAARDYELLWNGAASVCTSASAG
jgi:hypothetical protein